MFKEASWNLHLWQTVKGKQGTSYMAAGEWEQGGKCHTFRPSDLMRTHSLSWEQHGGTTSHDPITSHQVSPLTLGDYNLRWDLGRYTDVNHIIPPQPLPNLMCFSHFKTNHVIMSSKRSLKVLTHSSINPKVQVQSVNWDKSSPSHLWACKIKSKLVTS